MRIFMLSAALLAAAVFGPAQADAVENKMEVSEKKEVKLSKKQQKELGTLYKDIVDKRKQLINKYVEYGMISDEKGKKLKSHLDEHYKKMKENGFILQWDQSKKKHHR